MRPKQPEGFYILSFLAVLCACSMAVLVADPSTDPVPLVRARMVYGVTGVLALVTAEALWCVRKWAFRASLALASMYGVMVFVLLELAPALFVAAGSAVFIAIALRVVYRGLYSGPTVGRIRIPAPLP